MMTFAPSNSPEKIYRDSRRLGTMQVRRNDLEMKGIAKTEPSNSSDDFPTETACNCNPQFKLKVTK